MRRQSKVLVTIGACATSGGFQALRNIGNYDEILRNVYAHPEYIERARNLDNRLPIMFRSSSSCAAVRCPSNQLLEVVAAALAGRRPNVPNYSQCVECKRAGIVCVMVAHGTPCLGPVTQAGCGSLCPSCEQRLLWLFSGRRKHPTPPASAITSPAISRSVTAPPPIFSEPSMPEPKRSVMRPPAMTITEAPVQGDRTIVVDELARVEGEGALDVKVENGVITDIKFRIVEPPRFFEALLRGRMYSDAPDVDRAHLRHLPDRLYARRHQRHGRRAWRCGLGTG